MLSKFWILSLLIFTFSCCSLPPKDPSIPEINNHFRVEMDINGYTSIGLSGIAYTDRNQLNNSYLNFYPVYKGSMEFWSERCGKFFSASYNKNQILKVKITDLITPTDMTCTYRIHRVIKDADNTMVGYFGIKYISNPQTPLKMEAGGTVFPSGISWLQVREGIIIPTNKSLRNTEYVQVASNTFINESKVLKIYPKGNQGSIVFKGCDVTFPSIPYLSTPVTIDLADIFPNGLQVKDSCDYSIIATNFDTPEIEEAMFMLNVYKRETQWLETPNLSSGFNDWVKIKYYNPYILGIAIDSKVCENSSYCGTFCDNGPNEDSCIVRAVTRSGRFFWGKIKNNNWIELK